MAALKKPSRTLAVSLEYSPAEGQPTAAAADLEVVSMQLRQAKVSSIWTSDLRALAEFAKEQSSAAGNFPGPCPVVYNGDSGASELDDAISAGANAVVLTASDGGSFETAKFVEERGGGDVEVIWKVSSPDDVRAVSDSGMGGGCAFLVDPSLERTESVFASIPKSSAVVVKVKSMQDDDGEISEGREAKSLGCTAVLVERAVACDAEDLDYARFVVGGLTSKASSEFKVTGLTGSINGHFGGVESSGTKKWRRVQHQ